MKTSLLFLFPAFAAALHGADGVGFFLGEGLTDKPDPTLPSQRLDYIESRLGIQRHWFQYSIPRGKKLIATLAIELDGKPFAGGAGVYHIAPPINPKVTEQRLRISTFSPSDPILSSQNMVWNVNFDGAFNLSFFFPRAALERGGSVAKSMPLSSLEPSKDYEAWSYVVRADNKEAGGKDACRFTLTVRVEPIEPADKLGEVRKVE